MEHQKKWLSDREVGERYGISRVSAWRWSKLGYLPKPEKLGPGTTRWSTQKLDDNDRKRSEEAA